MVVQADTSAVGEEAYTGAEHNIEVEGAYTGLEVDNKAEEGVDIGAEEEVDIGAEEVVDIEVEEEVDIEAEEGVDTGAEGEGLGTEAGIAGQEVAGYSLREHSKDWRGEVQALVPALMLEILNVVVFET